MDTNAVFCPRYPLHLHQYGDDGTFTQLGMSETDAALYTGWLYLPWVIKPFWGPLVDIMKTKRWWTVIMQLCVAVGLAGIAFTLPQPTGEEIKAGLHINEFTIACSFTFLPLSARPHMT